MQFRAPQLGALGTTFTVMRACQFAILISMIGLASHFISDILLEDRQPPAELIGTLTVAITAVVYAVVTYILYYDAMLPFLFTGILDGVLLVASIVVAALLGKPLSTLNCAILPSTSESLTTYTTTLPFPVRATSITQSLSYLVFIATNQTTCQQTKAIWGLSITLCILFAFSSLVCVGLWQRGRAGAYGGFVGTVAKQPWESDASLGTKSLITTTITAAPVPQFPPPPLAPIRVGGRHNPPVPDNIPLPSIRPRIGLPMHHTPMSRFSCDSSDSSSISDYGSPPQPRGGLRPPPLRKSFRASMAPIPGSPTDETDAAAISPIMASIPPPLEYPRKAITSPSDDVIPDEHKRVPGLLPRSPLSPMLGFMAKRAVRKQVPEPIAVVGPRSAKGEMCSPGMESVALGSPAPVVEKRRTRKTVWEGWWDLGLLERMGTLRRKKTNGSNMI
ncbi:hypothetical protein OQA88_8273 [Cercophora sp. LCS_1]